MTKRKFIDTLRLALTGRVSTGTVLEHVNYYEEYFAMQMNQGFTEEEVCQSLGDAHLIAKSLIEADKFEQGESEELEAEIIGEEKKKSSFKSIKIPGIVITLIILFIVFFFVRVAFSLVLFALPYVVPVLLVIYAFKFFTSYK